MFLITDRVPRRGFPERTPRRQERDGLAEVVAKARGRHGVFHGEQVPQADAVNEGSLRVVASIGGTAQHVGEALRAASGDGQDTESVRASILVLLVELHLVFPAVVDTSRAGDRLGPVVDLQEIREAKFRIRCQHDCAIGIQALVADAQPQCVLAADIHNGNSRLVGSDEQVDDDLGEGLRVRLPGDSNWAEPSASRRDGVVPVPEPVAEGSEGVIAQGALAGSGIRPLTHPAGGAEGLQAFLYAAFRGEGIGKRRAELEDLADGQRTAIESLEEVAIPSRDKAERGYCHARQCSLLCQPFFPQPMPAEKKSFVHVDELMPQIAIEDVARYYGVELPELHRVGGETRSRCFLLCGRSHETGDRALAIQTGHPAKQWHCHQYGCGKGGNLVSLCDLMKPGDSVGGRPRGERFKEIAKDLLAMTQGSNAAPAATAPAVPSPPPAAEPRQNVPLARSPNERARALTELDRKFTLDLAGMPPRASAYLRRRPFLSSEVCRKWRMGYLPRDTNEDKSGGTMRGKIVYPYCSDNGEILTWFGRDPNFEEKHKAWSATDRSEREPEKFHFVKGFHRGLELFGQHRLRDSEAAATLKSLGLIVVEGPNDVIRLDTLGVTAVGLCSNTITREQAAKAAQLARELGNGIVTIMLDCDPEGENGMKQCLGYVSQLAPVRLAWTSRMYGGKFKGRQPEALTVEQWAEIRDYLVSGQKSWSLD